ncbi:TetR/AcrR family transcriptional regulator [Streptomyces globisporus]|uniref:TetR/AcrR family transcriptional regulator n=1 Tax=Streptomyces TaxID=1883 RepID=UPI001F202084|nr:MULTISPECIES: TetR/AcrR family transcriptional regulator [unclassified Streptomyces]UIZ16309.1 TetR/AcrR family transcriptional regulator [Streptomyces sp. R527F]
MDEHDGHDGAVADGETGLTLNELARRAGVGVGTVYRVFPTQRAMLESVLEEAVRQLADAAEEAHGRPDPASALVDFLRTARGGPGPARSHRRADHRVRRDGVAEPGQGGAGRGRLGPARAGAPGPRAHR